MRVRFFDENLNNIFGLCKKMLDQLNYTYNCSVDMHLDSLIINGSKSDWKIIMQIKRARKGIVKVSVEIVKSISNVADYEQKKKMEVSLLNSLEIFLRPVEDVELGV